MMSGSKLEPFSSDSDSEDDIESEFEYLTLQNYVVDKVVQHKWEEVAKRLEAIPPSETETNTEIAELSLLATEAATPAQQVHILVFLIKACFYTKPTIYHSMPIHIWHLCLKTIKITIDVLKVNPNILMSNDHNVVVNPKIETKKGGDYKGVIRVWGDLPLYLSRLYGDYILSLASLGHKSENYKDRLKGEDILVETAVNAFTYYKELKEDYAKALKVALLALALLYYRTEEDHRRRFLSHPTYPAEGCSKLLDMLASFVCEYGEKKDSDIAVLYRWYYWVSNNSLPRRSNDINMVQSIFESNEDSTRILYNRVVSQIGIFVFRRGFPEASHSYLMKLFRRGKITTVLAQETEDPVRGVGMPYHMQIDIELLASIYLVSALVISKKGGIIVVKKAIKHLTASIPSPTLLTVRSNIFLTYREFKRGGMSLSAIKNMDFWVQFESKADIRQMLLTKIKEAACNEPMPTPQVA